MDIMTKVLDEYLELRRGLGFKMKDEERMLRGFIGFMSSQNAPCITQQLSLDWALQAVHAKPVTKANRLSAVRSFARYVYGVDPRTEIPSQRLLPTKRNRPRPYLYSDEEVCALLQAARNMGSPGRLTALLPLTHYCLFGLLSVTGMRLGEACGLEVRDVDLSAAVVTVRKAKHNRTRLVPLHESTRDMLADYVERRNRHWSGRDVSDYLFVSSRGNRLNRTGVGHQFRKLSHQIGLRRPGDDRGPRIHDLRHTFSVRTLENWYRHGDDPEKLLPILAIYLGHIQLSDTYWYLELSPGLMKAAMERLEHRWEGPS